jgi:hypothetical protein
LVKCCLLALAQNRLAVAVDGPAGVGLISGAHLVLGDGVRFFVVLDAGVGAALV